MSNPRDDLSPETEAFVHSLRDGYAPEPPSPARAQAFDAELRERLEAPERQSRFRPALATAAVAALIGWLLMPPGSAPVEESDAAPVLAERMEEAEGNAFAFSDPGDVMEWEAELLGASAVLDFDPSEVLDFDPSAQDAALPDEYQAIAGFFLDG